MRDWGTRNPSEAQISASDCLLYPLQQWSANSTVSELHPKDRICSSPRSRSSSFSVQPHRATVLCRQRRGNYGTGRSVETKQGGKVLPAAPSWVCRIELAEQGSMGGQTPMYLQRQWGKCFWGKWPEIFLWSCSAPPSLPVLTRNCFLVGLKVSEPKVRRPCWWVHFLGKIRMDYGAWILVFHSQNYNGQQYRIGYQTMLQQY